MVKSVSTLVSVSTVRESEEDGASEVLATEVGLGAVEEDSEIVL